MDLGGLKVGVNVDIQRSDGRIHSAVVSGVSLESRTVTVEWFEKGETKGKEIEMEAIFELNPELLAQNNNSSSKMLQQKLPQLREDGDIDIDSIEQEGEVYYECEAEEEVSEELDNRPGTQQKHNNRPYIESQAQKETARTKPQNNSRRPTTSQGTAQSVPSARSSRPSYARTPGGKSVVAMNAENAAPPPEPKKIVVAKAVANAQDAAARRKSNCVSEVERIAEQRKQRRAAHAAIREHQESNYDTTRPNWEFEAMIDNYRESLEYRPLSVSEPMSNHKICVCVRKRPMNKKEINKKDVDVITVPTKDNVIVHEPKTKVDLTKFLENQNFRFDYAFDETANNELVYKFTAKPLVECVFEQGMATCFAYGQTGSGKTHTMGGDFQAKGQQDCTKGIYALAARDVFRLLNSKYKKDNLTISASFFEIYSGKVFDLLNKKLKLRVMEDGKQQVQIVGLKEEVVGSVEDVLQLIQDGNIVRTSGTTSANNHSSRSHAVFQIILRKKQSRKLHGKFSLIDLAGNERGADTSSADRQTRMEGAEINKSLLALKECIRAMSRKREHLPFRASKLTQVLRDSFIGDKSRTCMISMISPGMSCCEHTLNTLRYADRVKELGPGGPVEGKAALSPDSDHYSNISAGAMSPQNSDLYMLRSTNEEEENSHYLLSGYCIHRGHPEEEVSQDLLTFHEVINHMQEQEEQVLDEHHNLIQQTESWLDSDKRLMAMTEEVDYDVEAYSYQLDALLTKKIEAMMQLKEKVSQFRSELKQEEDLSKNMKKKPSHK